MLVNAWHCVKHSTYVTPSLGHSQITTPVAIMTSDAKGNHKRMTELMESLGWFGRGKEAFKLFRCAGLWLCVWG